MEHKEKIEIEPKKQRTMSLGASIIVAAVLISGAIIFSSSAKSEDKVAGGKIPIEPVSAEDFVRGNPNAEITIVEYSDFSCGFCGIHHPTLKKLIENYNGKVKWVYRHLPIFNQPAAVASQCVGNIGGNDKFWEYSDILMADQKSINQSYLKDKAVSLGIDGEAYETCVNNGIVSSKISKDFSRTRILAGFNSTPSQVLIDASGNMYPFTGALGLEEMSALVDSVL